MTGYVIDASVAAKWVLAEEGSERAATLFSHRLLGPDLLFVECANIFWKAVRRGRLTDAEALQGLEIIAATGIGAVPSAPLLGGALRRANRLGHPVYDCLFLETAAHVGLPLVTADRRLLALAGEGAQVLHLSDLPA
ncbi:type II toxin-antitoxin system VapC family toxin [Roseomonas sp. CCTCC AB2023176]|uniref:type II toxin-antitoxin system VapC family toxin n=1 Tax=Roseomonas sp. CCTCC AB2023176 TaxID=3342640 RepID=UPI0035DCB607